MAGKKDKLTTALLSWFFGMFGVHRFYLGQTGLGIAYLLGTFSLIGMIITAPAILIDTIAFLIMPQEDFDRKYNPMLQEQQMGFLNRPVNVNVADELHKLDLLFKRGVITFEEFEKRKAQLLNS